MYIFFNIINQNKSYLNKAANYIIFVYLLKKKGHSILYI